MAARPGFDPEQRGSSGWMAVINGLLAGVIMLVILQLWLLTVALDALLAGNLAETAGLAVASGLAFLGCLGALSVARR
ncbi:MAG: DUF6755 family protein [Sphingomonadaceae bacterium]